MIDPRAVSRRTSLKCLGTAGAAIVIGGAASASAEQESTPKGDQDKAAVNVVEVAAARMAKGHS